MRGKTNRIAVQEDEGADQVEKLVDQIRVRRLVINLVGHASARFEHLGARARRGRFARTCFCYSDGRQSPRRHGGRARSPSLCPDRRKRASPCRRHLQCLAGVSPGGAAAAPMSVALLKTKRRESGRCDFAASSSTVDRRLLYAKEFLLMMTAYRHAPSDQRCRQRAAPGAAASSRIRAPSI